MTDSMYGTLDIAKLQEMERNLQALLANVPLGIAYHRMIYDDSGAPVDYLFLEVNDRFIELIGVDPCGKRVTQVFPGIENDPFDWIGVYGQVTQTGESTSFERYFPVNDCWYDCYAYQFKPDHFAVVFLDITNSKQAQLALHQSEQRLLSIIESVPVPFAIVNTQGNFTFLNPAFVQTIGYTVADIPSLEDWWSLAFPDPHYRKMRMDIWQEFVEQIDFSGNFFPQDEVDILCRDNVVRTFLRSAVNLRENFGGDHLLFLYEITTHKQAENKKLELEKQFQQTQKLESLGVLTGGIAHNFNNLLAIIVGNCSLAKLRPETTVSRIPTIENAAERATDLCRQMLVYAGETLPVKEELDLADLVADMVSMLKATLPRNVVIWSDLATGLPLIEVDAGQLRQLVLNLILNASEAIGDAQGTVAVSLTNAAVLEEGVVRDYLGMAIFTGRYVCLEVTDNGCGMDEQTRGRVFEPFYTSKFTGRGLGLATVNGIIDAHNGAIQLFSQVGTGTTFKIFLPIKIETVVATKTLQSLNAKVSQGICTALLVEDEEMFILIAKAMLEELGFRVIVALNGEEALTLFQENVADITLVLTDIGMPVMDGYVLFRELKKRAPDLPIFISSGFCDVDVVSRIPREDISGIISKPYNYEQLQEVLRNGLNPR